jgi:uncharacterized protein (DUF4415 family)
MARTKEKSGSFTSEELRARSAAGMSKSKWEWVRTHEPDLTDPDAPEVHEEMRAELKRLRGRPKGSGTKVATSRRIDIDALAAWRATGPGWQTRANAALRSAIEGISARQKRSRGTVKPKKRTAHNSLAR